MATIEKRERPGGTYYRARVRIKGLPEQQKTFKRRTDAKLWAQQTEAAIHKGEFKSVAKNAKSKTLSDVIKRYRREVLPHKAASTQRVAETYLTHWENVLGDYGLTYIEPDTITAELDKLADAGDGRRQLEEGQKPNRPKSRKTLKLYRDMLAQLFKHARMWGWATHNPMDGVGSITKIRNERTRFLSDDERAKLLAACQASENKHLYPIVVFALSTGARKSEILKLTLSDIDLERGAAVLRDTKNGETRAAPIAAHLKAILKDHAAEAAALYDGMKNPPATRWLFPRSDGMAPIDIRTAWENARDNAGLADFRFHDLRHSTASYLAMKGASLMEIAEVLGHRTLQMVRRYAHLSESHVKGLVESLNDDLFPADNPGS